MDSLWSDQVHNLQAASAPRWQVQKYCHTCAYTKGVCAMCGKQVLDTKTYKQSNV
ncbi:Cysteine-rich PDZ-binding protein [Linum grandiflorum]